MDHFTVFKKSCASNLFSFDGVTGSAAGMKAAEEIKDFAKNLGVYITLWSNDKISFVCVYMHTIKVPAKAVKDLESLKAWIFERAAYYYKYDRKKIGLL